MTFEQMSIGLRAMALDPVAPGSECDPKPEGLTDLKRLMCQDAKCPHCQQKATHNHSTDGIGFGAVCDCCCRVKKLPGCLRSKV